MFIYLPMHIIISACICQPPSLLFQTDTHTHKHTLSLSISLSLILSLSIYLSIALSDLNLSYI